MYLNNNIAHIVKKDNNHKLTLKYRIASVNIEINCLYGYSFLDFRKYISNFTEPDIRVDVTQEDIDEERLMRTDIPEPIVMVDDERVAVTYDFGCLEPQVAMKKTAEAIISYDTFLFHGAVIEKDGYAYMFTAPSGVGKTTRIRLWLDNYPDSVIVNGDKPFIKITGEKAIACGSPWCGKEGWNNNIMVPLRAIFLLDRAESDEENSVTEISIGKAFPFLLKQAYCPKDPDAMRKTIWLLRSLEGKVKFYRFHSAPTHEAVKLAFETARPR